MITIDLTASLYDGDVLLTDMENKPITIDLVLKNHVLRQAYFNDDMGRELFQLLQKTLKEDNKQIALRYSNQSELIKTWIYKTQLPAIVMDSLINVFEYGNVNYSKSIIEEEKSDIGSDLEV